jgi:mRNA-decapping enzyme subunit 2
MLNHAMDSVILVKGWKKGANWSFPRGKINKDEDDLDCAIREVYEETGYDIREAGLVPSEEEVKYIEMTMREQHMRLYVFRDVPMDTHFEPRTRKEISKIEWYRLSDLPAFRKKGQQQANDGAQNAVNANKFYMVAPFLVPLKKWVVQQKKKDAQRPVSNQFLAPPYMEDVITEEETGTDHNAYVTQSESESKPFAPTPGMDTLAGATAALHRLLKIQPPTQGLQTASAVQSPVVKDTGGALLALLHGKSKKDGTSNNIPTLPPHTPLDHTITAAPVPKTPQHHYSHQEQLFSRMDPPPPFSLQQFQTTHPYQPRQQPQQTIQPRNSGYPNAQQNYIPSYPLPQQPQNIAHRSDHPQQLQHPQPLPPQVQKAVFNGFQVHSPMISQNTAHQQDPRIHPQAPGSIQNPQFPNIHVPIIPPSITQEPPRLTSHSLALLDAFKSRETGSSSADSPSDLPLRRFTDGVEAPPIRAEDLPGRHNPAEMSGDDMPQPSIQMLPARSAPTDPHRSSLLNMFKSPNRVDPFSTSPAESISTSQIPKAEQQFSASNSLAPSFGAPRAPGAKTAGHETKGLKSNSPFRPMAILSRPTQQNLPSGPPSAGLETPKAPSNGKPRSSASPKRNQPSPQKRANPAAPFQPQILKRPQPQQPMPIVPMELAAASPVAPAFTGFQVPAVPNRQPAAPSGHKQNLLSLFGKTPTVPMPQLNAPGASPVNEEAPSIAAFTGRSRVGSLASAAGDPNLSRRGSQTPTSPANTAFLLGYLNGIAKNNGR